MRNRKKTEVEQYSDGTPVEGGYLDQICQGKYYNMPEELKWKDMEDKYQNLRELLTAIVTSARHMHSLERAFRI